jgi:S-adenosylmethionine decarboxylase proenzyme
MRHQFFGRHLLASYIDCKTEILTDSKACLEALRKAVLATGAHILSNAVHEFPNGAVTIVLLLSESHASIHTYPEHRSCFIDFFSCGNCDFRALDTILREELSPGEVVFEIVARGADNRFPNL